MPRQQRKPCEIRAPNFEGVGLEGDWACMGQKSACPYGRESSDPPEQRQYCAIVYIPAALPTNIGRKMVKHLPETVQHCRIPDETPRLLDGHLVPHVLARLDDTERPFPEDDIPLVQLVEPHTT